MSNESGFSRKWRDEGSDHQQKKGFGERGKRGFGNRGDRGKRGFQADRSSFDGNRFDRDGQADSNDRRSGADRGEQRQFGRRGQRDNYQRRNRDGQRRFDREDGGQQRFSERRFTRRQGGQRDTGSGERRFDRSGSKRRWDSKGGFDRRGSGNRERGGFSRGRRADRRDDYRGRRQFDRGNNRGHRQEEYNVNDQFDREFDEQNNQIDGLEIPAGVEASELDSQAFAALRTLGERNQEVVAKLLVMSGQLIDLEPELAYSYAQAAVKRAGRVDVVREAAALTAYASGRYAEALREVRALRRMRGDYSLRAVEADCERGQGRPQKALELIEDTDLTHVELAEQVELVLVAAGARKDLGELETALVLVGDALAKLGPDSDDDMRRRLMSAQAEYLNDLGRTLEAEQVEAQIPAEPEDNDIIDAQLLATADVDAKRSDLKGSAEPLTDRYDAVLLDLDGVCYMGKNPVPYAAQEVAKAVESGMQQVFVTNNAARSPQAIVEQLTSFDLPADTKHVMTAAMDIAHIMSEELPAGARVYVIGGQGLREAVQEAGFEVVASADDHPDAVVQGFDRSVDWQTLSEGAFAINAGAKYYASNLDASLPVERGFALGNGALVRAVRYATNVKPTAGGKPLPGIYHRATALVGAEHPVAVGDRLETDVAGALQASVPCLHVLTGVHDAKAVILAERGLRPQLVHTDMRGLNEAHPRPQHHKDGTWTCGVSQVAQVIGNQLTLDGVVLDSDNVQVTLDSYRALIAAAWEYSETGSKVECPIIQVVDNDDPTGIVNPPSQPEGVSNPEENSQAEGGSEPHTGAQPATGSTAEGEAQPEGKSEPVESPSTADEVEREDLGVQPGDPDAPSDAQLDQVDVESVPAFLPGEEDLKELMENTWHLEEDEVDGDGN
ncbi:HAD hydrolase-like protein [Gleimia hominis]|uniref:HAD hydrolase-like protein n=1 Tax=Gleimia hominis TaxID=595468 RepID=UPI000C809CA4|nr:HAD hydrolase-like protein [Gleimia hominis]WIK65270.1 HAD hydrolase-like protein [Gleimia hominis]